MEFGPVSLPSKDNPVSLTLPFFFGMYLGDGYACVRLRTTETSLLVIPVFSIGQKLTSDGRVLMNRLSLAPRTEFFVETKTRFCLPQKTTLC
jgi:hypothetical protein